MLRRHARERREYLYKKEVENRERSKLLKRKAVTQSVDTNKSIHGDFQKDALEIYNKTKYGTQVSSIDDEYTYAGCEDPKIILTTSHNPSARLKMFVKELRLLFPNCQRMNRGNYELKSLMHACRANGATDFIIVHEHRGVPDNLVICHLPYGPTTFFNISGVVMRHDIPDLGTMSEQKPHLIFHNFKTALGERVVSILKHLFPVPKSDSKRIMTFANNGDHITFRHHIYQRNSNKEIELKELGPRFQLRLYQIKQGTLENLNTAHTEWVYRPFLNTFAKRLFLSNQEGWKETEE